MAVTGGKFGATITVVSTGLSYHTYTDWGLTITNPNPIGDPEQETSYLDVMGRSGLLNASKALTGKPVFKGRPINMEVAIKTDPDMWETAVSQLRNIVEGEEVKITFDDDTSHYWSGMINLRNTSRVARLGRFVLYAYVDAYKYDIASSQQKIKWDDMNFLTDCLRYLGTIQITDSGTITIPHGDMESVPTITVSNMTSDALTMYANTTRTTYQLTTGKNRFPGLKVCGASDVTLTFTGTAKVKIDYRGGSL